MLATSRVKKSVQQKIGVSDHWYRLGYNIFALVTLVLIILFQLNIKPFFLFKATTTIKILAAFFLITGLGIMAICIFKYFKQLSGIKNVAPVLVTTGLHRFVRHPLYLGTFIFLAGIVIAFPLISNLVAVIIIVIYTLWGIGAEEKKLVIQFGKHYVHYQETVPMILPSLFRKF
ncbi:MAG: isoprenylcysteine carboxylmethyltransferase family protein [Ferruginibacter sp.]